MKKSICSLLAGLMALSLALPCAAGVAVIKGDVDGDGQIAAADLTGLARRVGGIDTLVLYAEEEENGADIDENGVVDAADLTKLARHVGCIEAIGTEPLPYVELDYQILQKMDGVDTSGHVHVPGVFGPPIFYGSAYDIEKDENGMLINPPEECVLYTVSRWPDALVGTGAYVTEIVITDPRVTVMGLTVNSDFEDFDRIMEEAGYTIVYASDTVHSAEKDGVWYRLCKEPGEINEIKIVAEVANKDSIIY